MGTLAPVNRSFVALAVVAAASGVPPFLAELDVADSVEIVDHVVPAVVATLAALFAPATIALAICALSGFWEVATHVTLVFDAGTAGRPVGTVAVHALPGLALVGLSLWLLLGNEQR